MTGRIHSFQSMGAVDGPGIRFVVFMQGCPLRCVYCHNPDTWDKNNGTEYTPQQVLDKILRHKPYFSKSGGVTVSGGEPLMQWEFVKELFCLLKKENIHTALDTSGIGDLNGASEVLEYTDLVLCDIKFNNQVDYKTYCKGSLKDVLSFIDLTKQKNIPLWIRHVVVPNLTDSKENIIKISKLANSYSNLEKLELLPFSKLCMSKYESMGIEFPLKDTPSATAQVINDLYNIIKTS